MISLGSRGSRGRKARAFASAAVQAKICRGWWTGASGGRAGDGTRWALVACCAGLLFARFAGRQAFPWHEAAGHSTRLGRAGGGRAAASVTCAATCRSSSGSSALYPTSLPSRMQYVRFFARTTHPSCKASYAGVASAFYKRPFHSTLARRSTADMETVVTTERLAHLRQLMRDNQVDVYSTAASPIPHATPDADEMCHSRAV